MQLVNAAWNTQQYDDVEDELELFRNKQRYCRSNKK